MTRALNNNKRGPLFHVSKRGSLPWYKAWGIRAAALVLALILCGVITMLVTHENPVQIYITIFNGSFGPPRKVWIMLQNLAILLCISLAVTPAFRMRFWNIGGEGQALIGALASAACMICLRDFLPNWAIILCMIFASIAAGAIWGAIPAIFKAKWNTNETLFTLMMNYIVIKIVDFFFNKWRGVKSALGIINIDSEAGWIRSMWKGTESAWYKNEDLIFMIAVIVIAVLMYYYLRLTKHGYEIAVVGDSQNTAKYAGISVKKVIIRTMALSGALCGLCGFLCVSAQGHTVNSSLAGGYGFTAIIVAWLSKFNTFTMMGVSLLIVALENGSALMSNTYNDLGFSVAFGKIIVGVMLLFVIGCEFFINYKVNFRSRKTQKEAVEA